MEGVAGPSFRRGYTRALDNVREALLAELDRLGRFHKSPAVIDSGDYLSALNDVRRWAGDDGE